MNESTKLYNDLVEYNTMLEQLTLQTNIRGIEECDSPTMIEFIMEVANKAILLMKLLYPDYLNTRLIADQLEFIYFSERLGPILDDVVISIIPDSYYVNGYYDIIYQAGDGIIEDCYLELKKFIRNAEYEMDDAERLVYEKIIKDMACYLKDTGYFDKPLITNVMLGI